VEEYQPSDKLMRTTRQLIQENRIHVNKYDVESYMGLLLNNDTVLAELFPSAQGSEGKLLDLDHANEDFNYETIESHSPRIHRYSVDIDILTCYCKHYFKMGLCAHLVAALLHFNKNIPGQKCAKRPLQNGSGKSQCTTRACRGRPRKRGPALSYT
jgi:hypothetical protein